MSGEACLPLSSNQDMFAIVLLQAWNLTQRFSSPFFVSEIVSRNQLIKDTPITGLSMLLIKLYANTVHK